MYRDRVRLPSLLDKVMSAAEAADLIQDGMTVVVEPKPHWASDMRAFQLMDRAYGYYADWTGNGPGARFFAHPETCGDVVMTKARDMIACEIADGLWKP